jgi:hypothetical protein
MSKIDLSGIDLKENDDSNNIDLSGIDLKENNADDKIESNILTDVEDIARGAAQGATFGLSDEITGGLGALKDSILSGEDLLEAYKKHRDEARAANELSQERSPWLYGASDVGAGVLTGGGLTKLATKGAGLAKLLSDVSTRKDAIKAGLAGGGLAGLGYSDAETSPELLTDVAQGAALGGAIPSVLGLGKGVVSGITNLVGNNLADDVSRVADIYRKGDVDVLGKVSDVDAFAKSKALEAGSIINKEAQSALDTERLLYSDILTKNADNKLSFDDFTSKIKKELKSAGMNSREVDDFFNDPDKMRDVFQTYDSHITKNRVDLTQEVPDLEATEKFARDKLEQMGFNRGIDLTIGDLQTRGDKAVLPYSETVKKSKGLQGKMVQDIEEVLNMERAAQELQDKADLNAIKMNFDSPESVILNDQARLTKDKMLGEVIDPTSNSSRVIDVDIPVDIFKTNNMEASIEMINDKLVDSLTKQGLTLNDVTNVRPSMNPKTGKVTLNYDIITENAKTLPVDIRNKIVGTQDLTPSNIKDMQLINKGNTDEMAQILTGNRSVELGGQSRDFLTDIMRGQLDEASLPLVNESSQKMAALQQITDEVNPLLQADERFIKDIIESNKVAEALTQVKDRLSSSKNAVSTASQNLGLDQAKISEFENLLNEAVSAKELNTRYQNARSFAGGGDGIISGIVGSSARGAMAAGKKMGQLDNWLSNSPKIEKALGMKPGTLGSNGSAISNTIGGINKIVSRGAGKIVATKPELIDDSSLQEVANMVGDQDPTLAEEIRNASSRQEKALIQYKLITNPAYKKYLKNSQK